MCGQLRESRERYEVLQRSSQQRHEETSQKHEEAVSSLSRELSEKVLVRDRSIQDLLARQNALM